MRFFDPRARGDPDVEHVADVGGPQCRGAVQVGSDDFSKLVPRASRYLRYAALATFLTGTYMMLHRHPRWTIDVVVSSALGTLMLLNVWFIMWPKQRILTTYRRQSGRGGQVPAT